MHFASPLWFLLLPFWPAWEAWKFFRARAPWALPVSSLQLFERFVVSRHNKNVALALLKSLAWALFVTSLAQPQTVNRAPELPKPIVDIVLCLDTSGSMAALDFDPDDRLTAAKKAAEEFILKRPLDRLGLVVFGGAAVAQCPLTTDHATLIDFLSSIPLNATQTQGTAIGTALAASSELLQKSEAKSRVIILLTDGRNNTGAIDPVTAAEAIQKLGIKIYTIGTAVPGGGKILVQDSVFGRRFEQMQEDLDEPALRQIASITGGKYFRVTSRAEFSRIYEEIDALEKTDVKTNSLASFNDVFAPFLIAGAIAFCLAIVLEEFVWRQVPA